MVAGIGLSVATVVLIGALAGCGSGSGSTGHWSVGRHASSTPVPEASPGVGWKAPIKKTLGPRRRAAGVGRLTGTESIGAKGCPEEEGHGEIGIFTDVSQPNCVRVTGAEPVLIVNRTGAYHRSEEHAITVTLGPYRARLAPQEAMRLAPVGRFLKGGYHQAKIGTGPGGIGILVLPKDCAIFRPEPGEPLCFAGYRSGRLRRWRRTIARMGAPACHGADLAISREGHSSIGSGGTIYTKFFVTNRSDRPCTVAGVPEVVALDRSGKTVDVGEPRPLLRVGSKGGRLRVRLEPGRSATFVVAYDDGTPAGPCKFAATSGLHVAVPGTTARRFFHFGASYCTAPEWGLGLRVGRIE
jgi:hypothetical protein